MEFFKSESRTALEAKEEAQRIAFAPVVFQATRVLRNTGILELMGKCKDGLTLEEVVENSSLPKYGVRVLLEAGLGIGLLTLNNERYSLTKTGLFILTDKLTQVNMDFVHDVCYQGMFYLDESIREQKPAGLKVFGEWSTIYEALSELPPAVQKSWFNFDHFYSDYAFPEVLPHVFRHKPKSLLDIGGNTGKWTLACVNFDAAVEVTIMDLPGQIEMARKQVAKSSFANRIKFHACNLLNEADSFPSEFDAIWMSQFLDCFSEDQIKSILRRCHKALSPDGYVFILEPFWDRQRFEASAFVLQQTSLYFTAMANGNSQMYYAPNLIACIQEAGFDVVKQIDQIGVSHTLLVCKPV
jgi:ubiquinone/menaquinone biosynthesis C-methylase UbiE